MTILYEVYDKRALHQSIDTLVILDRDRDQLKAMKSARAWGGCVVKVTARILQLYPLQREVLSTEIFFVHKPRQKAMTASDTISIRELKGKLRMFDRGLYKKGRL